jgi:hypothetical protein
VFSGWRSAPLKKSVCIRVHPWLKFPRDDFIPRFAAARP